MLDPARLEDRAHRDAIRKFARGTQIDETSALEIYERERYSLTEGAKVTRYVGLLAEKHTRAVLVRLKSRSP